jgi:hypothetical protein
MLEKSKSQFPTISVSAATENDDFMDKKEKILSSEDKDFIKD